MKYNTKTNRMMKNDITYEYRVFTNRLIDIESMEVGNCTSKVIKNIKPKDKVDGRFFHTSDTDEWFFCWNGELQKLNIKENSDINAALDEVKKLIVDSKYIVETTDDNIALDNNKYYKKTNVSSSINITLNMPEDNKVFTSFSIEFTTSESGTSVSLPNSIKWLNGETPIFENNFTYQISVCNGLGVCVKYV